MLYIVDLKFWSIHAYAYHKYRTKETAKVMGVHAPVGAWFLPRWFSFRCDTLIDHIQLKQ